MSIVDINSVLMVYCSLVQMDLSLFYMESTVTRRQNRRIISSWPRIGPIFIPLVPTGATPTTNPTPTGQRLTEPRSMSLRLVDHPSSKQNGF